jgi:hypothetical protein
VSLRGKLTTGVAVVGVIWVGGMVLQSPSDGVDRIKGADRINEETVILTVRFAPDFDLGGPHSVAVSWDSHLGITGPSIDVGDDVANVSPYVRKISVVKGARVTAAASPATREGRIGADWITECWLHQDGKLMAGGRSHMGPVHGGMGCAVSGTAT